MKKPYQFNIPFNKPYLTGQELGYIKEAHDIGMLSGDGSFTKKCHDFLERNLGTKKALLTHSCTAALEMMAMLLDIQPGDEVIMPSYNFVSSANAFVLRGAIPVFVDIRPDTLNLDENLTERAITIKTKAIVPVHYAGVGCEMDKIIDIANNYQLSVVEDAAQGIFSKYNNKFLGTIGDLGAISFHETKNVISGEGGALLINNEKYIERAEIIREKGTNRSKFFRGQVDKYTWVDIGSSYLPGEVIAAFLLAQLEKVQEINRKRISIWNKYHQQLAGLEESGYIIRPKIPANCQANGHLYYVLVKDLSTRTKLIDFLKQRDVLSVFHFVPLHSSPAGKKFCRAVGKLVVTESIADRLIKLPLFYTITNSEIDYVVESIINFFE